MQSDISDVTFVVGGEKIPAHKMILAAQSSYFRALLYGGLAETTQKEIELDVPIEAFKALLEFMYSGRMSLAKMNMKDVLDILSLTHEYGFEALELRICKHLMVVLSLDNCCVILENAILYSFDVLRDACITFMDRHANKILDQDAFKTLSQDSLCSLLERDSFFAPEIKIFEAVNDWYKSNPNADIQVNGKKYNFCFQSLFCSIKKYFFI